MRILRLFNTKFEYEKYEFKFPVERGTMFYLPDFYLPDKDQFIELKGHLDQKSRTQLSRFLQYYPDKAKRMRIVIRKLFDSKAHLTKEAAMIEVRGIRYCHCGGLLFRQRGRYGKFVACTNCKFRENVCSTVQVEELQSLHRQS